MDWLGLNTWQWLAVFGGLTLLILLPLVAMAALIWLGAKRTKLAFERFVKPDPVALEARMRDLRRRYPGLDEAGLVRRIIARESLKVGLVGAVTGLGGLITLPIAIPIDFALTAKLQAALIHFIARSLCARRDRGNAAPQDLRHHGGQPAHAPGDRDIEPGRSGRGGEGRYPLAGGSRCGGAPQDRALYRRRGGLCPQLGRHAGRGPSGRELVHGQARDGRPAGAGSASPAVLRRYGTGLGSIPLNDRRIDCRHAVCYDHPQSNTIRLPSSQLSSQPRRGPQMEHMAAGPFRGTHSVMAGCLLNRPLFREGG